MSCVTNSKVIPNCRHTRRTRSSRSARVCASTAANGSSISITRGWNAIARAIAFQPRVMLMDEPFAAVDAQTRADLEDLVRRVWRQFGITLLFVTHDIDESVYLGERVVMLSASPTRVMENLD